MADMKYWQNVNNAICGDIGSGRPNSAHRIKLFRYRARAKYGRRKPFLSALNELRAKMAAAKPAGGE